MKNRVQAIQQAAKILEKAGVKGYITIHDNPFAVAVMKEKGINPDPTPSKSIASHCVIDTPFIVWVASSYEDPEV